MTKLLSFFSAFFCFFSPCSFFFQVLIISIFSCKVFNLGLQYGQFIKLFCWIQGVWIWKIFLWYTYSNMGYHNLRCTCRSYDKAKALEKLLGCIWLISYLNPSSNPGSKSQRFGLRNWKKKCASVKLHTFKTIFDISWKLLTKNSIYMTMRYLTLFVLFPSAILAR